MRNAAQLRDEILAAARGEFAMYGLAGARIDRIAKNASASKERIYAHFGDKEALFRLVVSTDGAEFLRSLSIRPEAVPEFAGDVFDLARTRPEHLRMITWARLEGLPLEPPEFESGNPIPERDLAAIAAAQKAGHVDARWDPVELLVLLFGIGMAWVHMPQLEFLDEDAAAVAARRAAVVEAAARVVAPARPR